MKMSFMDRMILILMKLKRRAMRKVPKARKRKN